MPQSPTNAFVNRIFLSLYTFFCAHISCFDYERVCLRVGQTVGRHQQVECNVGNTSVSPARRKRNVQDRAYTYSWRARPFTPFVHSFNEMSDDFRVERFA